MRLIILLLFIIACSSGTTMTQTEPLPKNRCLPNIEPSGEWLAADGGRSIVLPNGTFIHLFGDTILQDPYGFIGNSIGQAKCSSNGDYSIEYHWQEIDGTRQAFFNLDVSGVRMWPSDGFYHEGKLYVTLINVISIEYGLGFAYAGATLAIVSNPLNDPASWNTRYLAFPDIGLRPTKGITLVDDFAYIFGSLEDNNYSAILMRLPLSNIHPSKLEYLSVSGYRNVSTFSNDAAIVLEHSPPGFYVSSYRNKWISIHNSSTFGSDQLVIRTANELEGPWTEEKLVYKVPEIKANNKNIVCYAGTEHPQLRINDSFVVTYSCNTVGIFPILEEAYQYVDLYLPKTVLIEHIDKLIYVE